MRASVPSPSAWRDAWFAATVALLVFPLLFAQSMLRGLNHDEHQHLAAGILIATEGLLPYRDFPYFHPPVLPLLYAAFLRSGDMLLLEGRLLSTICATLTVGLVAWLALRWNPAASRRSRITLGLAAVGLLISAPVFAETVGRVSNHELSVLFALVAVAFHLAAMARPGRIAAWLASGIFLALAIGTRVTLAPLVLPFLAAGWLWSAPPRRADRVRAAGWFVAGLFVGGLPTIAMFLAAPASFFYGVLEFSVTNLAYRDSTGNTQTMTLLTKLRFFFQPILVTHGSLALALAGTVILGGWQSWKHRAPFPPRLRFLLLLLPFVLMGALAPSPSFLLYYYALAPFAVLATIAAAAECLPAAPRAFRAFFAALVFVGIAVAVPRYESVREFPFYHEWTPPDVHTDARDLRQHLEGGRILTLAPTRVLEAGFSIYPAFATGPFAWRVASLVDPEKRLRLGMVAPVNLESYLRTQPPDGILVGREDLLEAPFLEYARRHGYLPAPIWNGRETLWRKPADSARPAQ